MKFVIKYDFCKENIVKSCAFTMKKCIFTHNGVVGGRHTYAQGIPPWHMSVGECALFHSEYATFHKNFVKSCTFATKSCAFVMTNPAKT